MGISMIIGLAVHVLLKIVPLVMDVYQKVNDPKQPEFTADNALDMIKAAAGAAGHPIGNTEAELARSAVHFALAKAVRHPQD